MSSPPSIPSAEQFLAPRRALLIGGLASLAGVLPRKSQAATAGLNPGSTDPTFWQQPRAVKVQNADTGQRGEFVYWRDGAYVMEDYYALCTLGFDRRENKAVQIDPRVFDLVYATQAWFFGIERKRPLTLLTSVYRTSKTNRIVGGSPNSTHIEGKAADGDMEGVSPRVYAAMLLTFKAGGVGLYEKHCHWDVGRSPLFWRGGKVES